MNFRRFLLFLAVFWLISVCGNNLFAQNTNSAQNADTNLTADILEKTLYAKTPAEKKYCQAVIAARDAHILPNRILYSAYRYAMNKDKDRRLAYFQTTLTKFCKEAGVTLTTTESKKTSYNPFSFFMSPFK